MKKISLTMLSLAMVALSMGQKVATPNSKQSTAKPAEQKTEITNPNPNQTPSIVQFEKTTFDFATIKEEKGIVTGVFKFKNTGRQDIQILNVRPSCGCTTSEYTKEVVKPGGTGVVKATYDPAGRPGPFNKSIAVTTNDQNSPNITLFIKGNVLPKPKTKEELYPVVQGSLRFMTNHLSFNLTNNESKVDTIKIYNAGTKKLELNLSKVPVYVAILSPVVVKLDPLAESRIIVKYDAAKRNEIGFSYDKFSFSSNDTAQVEKVVYLSANINEDFSKLTPEQLLNAPAISIENENYDFGKIKLGEVVDYWFVIKNTGKSSLIIRKVKASCGCTAAQPEQTEIAPGQSTRIKASFNSAGRMGQQHKTITVITNDPKRSNITLSIKGEVIKDGSVEIKGDPQKGEGSGTIYKVN